MRMNTNIAMMGQPVDVVGSMGRGAQAAGLINQVGDQNAMRNALAQHGAGLVQGDQGAVNALAGLDPSMVLNAQNAQSTMREREAAGQRDEQRLRLAFEASHRQGLQLSMQMSAQQRAQEAAQLDQALAAATTAQSPEEWDRIMSGFGEQGQQFVGQFERRGELIAGAMGLAEALKMQQGPEAQSPEGRFEADRRRGLLPEDAQRGRDPAAEQRIARLMESGLDRDTAIGIADGRLAVTDGRVVDRATGQIVGETQTPMDMAQAPRAQGPGIYDRADDATGFAPTIGRAISATAGQLPGIGGLFQAPDMVAAGQAFQQAQNDLVRAISINPRFPVAEMQMIRDELGIRPGMLQSPDDARARMRELDGYLRRRMEVEARAQNDSSLPRSERDNAARAVRDIDNFLGILGVPERGGGREDIPPPPASLPAEHRDLWEFMTPEDRALWQD